MLGFSLGAAGLPATMQGMAQASILSLIGWDEERFPLSFTKTSGTWSSDFDRNDYAPDSLFTTTYFVDVTNGNDSNSGLTTGDKLQSVWKAIELGNASGDGFEVIVDPATYPRARSLTKTGVVHPTQDCKITTSSGRAVLTYHDDLSWAQDGTYTNCYRSTRSNVGVVYDLDNINANGDYVELAYVADEATCQSTTGSWTPVDDNTGILVHRPDSGAVTNANTRVFLHAGNKFINSAASNGITLFMENIDFEGGGIDRPVTIEDATGLVAIFSNCSFKYGGSYKLGSPSYRDGAYLSDASGLFVFQSCRASSNYKDGFNAHWTVDANREMFVLTEACKGIDTGRLSSTSNNHLTGHETVTWIDVNGDYSYGRGGNIRFIDTSNLLCLGTSSCFDLGDGGATSEAAFKADGAAEMWLIDCSAEMSAGDDWAYVSTDDAVLYVRDFTNVFGQLDTTNVVTGWKHPIS